jgi:hypothetical protein
MIVCINRYGKILSCGDIINYIYLPFNEYCGLLPKLIYPVKTGSLYDCIIGVDREENFYLNVKNKFEYDSYGRVCKINGNNITYYTTGKISKIAFTNIDYRKNDGKLLNIGNLGIEHNFSSNYGGSLITKIGDNLIKYEGDDGYYSSCCPYKINDIDIQYNGGWLSKVNWDGIGYHRDLYAQEGCGDVLFKRIYLIDNIYIYYELKGINAGRVIKIGEKQVSYYDNGINCGLPSSYNGQSISYDIYNRIVSIN